jgi:hypothetical protein
MDRTHGDLHEWGGTWSIEPTVDLHGRGVLCRWDTIEIMNRPLSLLPSTTRLGPESLERGFCCSAWSIEPTSTFREGAEPNRLNPRSTFMRGVFFVIETQSRWWIEPSLFAIAHKVKSAWWIEPTVTFMSGVEPDRLNPPLTFMGGVYFVDETRSRSWIDPSLFCYWPQG